jgi:hypothetical protein
MLPVEEPGNQARPSKPPAKPSAGKNCSTFNASIIFFQVLKTAQRLSENHPSKKVRVIQ